MKKDKTAIKRKMSPVFYALTVFLIVYSISLLVPLFWGLITSLKNPQEYLDGNIIGLPSLKTSKKELLFGNYKTLLDAFNIRKSVSFFRFGNDPVTHTCDAGLLQIIFNSLIYCLGGATILAIVAVIKTDR